MKPHLRAPRSLHADIPAGALEAFRTVPQPVARPARPRLATSAGMDLGLSRTAPERVLPRARRAVKIGYVLDRFPRGSHGFVLQEILELESRGMEVQIFSLEMPDGRIDDTACALARLQSPVRYFPDASDMDEPGAESGAINWIASQVATRGIEHLHAHGATVPTDVAREAARLTGIGYSFTAHAAGLYEGADEESLCAKVLEARFVVALTDLDKRRLVSVCGAWSTPKVHHIPMGVNPEHFRFSGGEYHDSGSVLAVGPLIEKSGFTYLIEAIGTLRDRGRMARLTIFGEGEYEDTLREQIDRCRLAGRVQILSDLSRGELAMLMRTHTALVLPWVADDRDRDVLANVVLEAMAVGLVVLSTDVPGIHELIDDGLSGRVISPRDQLWLAGALETLFDSPELRGRMAARARSKVARLFSSPRNVAHLARLLVRTVNQVVAAE
jgi:glycosyltransferase involved in cell wall biosynthesis